MNIVFLCFLLFINAYKAENRGVDFQALFGSSSGWAFQGHLDVNKSVIKLNPQLRGIPIQNISKTMEICGFYVHYEKMSLFPFTVVVIDKKVGNAEIRLKPGINTIDLNDRYAFQIEAYDCDHPPHFSERKYVMIEVGTVYDPRFLRQTHHFTVNATLPPGSKIGEVVAVEPPSNDKSQATQGICRYDIISPGTVPVTIDHHGNLISKKFPTQAEVSVKYRFYVRATDCNVHQPRTVSVLVLLDIYDTCEPHWTDLPKYVKYIRAGGVLPLLNTHPKTPSIHVCSNSCSNFQVILIARIMGEKLKLATPENCHHDSKSFETQARICDSSVDTVDLLKLSTNSVIDPMSGSYFFKSDHVPVEVHMNNKYPLMGRIFSLSFWMKHGPMKPNSPKQQIICNSDMEIKNRHHFSLFLHNCKLILLIRKEHWELSQDQYQPTEWRYGPLKELCDNKWHHYGILYNADSIIFQIDGEIWQTLPEILVEKPLQKLVGNIRGTKFNIGSCYHSKTGTHVQKFTGYLAGMRLLNNSLMPINTIRCLATCGEALLLPHIIEAIDSGSSVTLFSQYIVLRSHNINDLLLMFSKLSYVNTNALSDIGNKRQRHRNITIDTEIRCDSGRILQFPQHHISMDIVESTNLLDAGLNKEPTIVLYSQSTVQGSRKKPVVLFPNVKFVQTDGFNVNIKSCIIRPINYPIQSFEYLNWPIDLAINFHLTSLNNTHGLILEGKQPLDIYELLIKKITYVTGKFDSKHSERKFGLICSIKEHVVTNEITVKVIIKQESFPTYYIVDDSEGDRDDPNKYQVLHSGNDRHGFEDKLVIPGKGKPLSRYSKTILLVLIPSIFFLLIICIVGFFIYYKRRQNRGMSLKQNFLYSNNKKVIRLKSMKNSFEEHTSLPLDNDNESIISDCPDSCEEPGGDDIDDCTNIPTSGNSQKVEIDRVTIPKYVSLPKTWTKSLNKPVDV